MGLKEDFRKNGYVIIKNAFTKEEINNLRKICFEEFKKVNINGNFEINRQIFTESFIKNTELLDPLFNNNIITQVKKVLGDDYISFADFSLSNNLHSPIWHTDSQSLGFSTQYVYNSLYNIAKIGLYLQEDDQTYGGQLDIIPRSHLPTFLGVNSPISSKKRLGKVSKLQLLAISLRNKFLKKISVNVALGDLVLFHGLLVHRSSQPDWSKVKQIDRHGIKNPPLNKNKFMFQWEVSENNEFANYYATHQLSRNHEKFNEAAEIKLENLAESTKAIFKTHNVNFKTYLDLKIPIHNKLKSKDGTPIIFNN